MDKKEIMEEIEKFDINNVEFNYDLSNVFTILRFSHKLEQAYLSSVSKKQNEFIPLFLECVSEWINQPENHQQVVINTTIKRFEPMRLTDKQIQTIIGIYGLISNEDVAYIKREYAIKYLMENQ